MHFAIWFYRFPFQLVHLLQDIWIFLAILNFKLASINWSNVKSCQHAKTYQLFLVLFFESFIYKQQQQKNRYLIGHTLVLCLKADNFCCEANARFNYSSIQYELMGKHVLILAKKIGNNFFFFFLLSHKNAYSKFKGSNVKKKYYSYV